MNLKRLFQGNFAAAALALPAVAGATVLNVDINGRRNDPPQDPVGITYSGTGPAGGSFVGVTADSDPTMSGSDNDSQTFSYTNLGGTGVNFSVGPAGGDNNSHPTNAADISALIGEYVFMFGGGETISNLPANSTANLYLYSDGRFGSLTVTGAGAPSTPVSSSAFSSGVYTSGNTLFFSGIQTGPTGTITIANSSGLSVISGFSVSTPEPASLGVLALGGLGLLARRRRA